MNQDQLIDSLPDLLRTRWHLHDVSVAPLGGGMNSTTALVTHDQQILVAKWVPTSGSAALHYGARIATRLADAGMRSGRPRPTVENQLATPVNAGSLALLEFVPGRELTNHPTDQPMQAEALARAHTVLGTSTHRASFFDWLGDEPEFDNVAEWIQPAIHVVVAEYHALPPLTWGTVHADPNTEAFLHDETTDSVGIIDWAGASDGPLLYDVASAVMYLGGLDNASAFLTRYTQLGPLPRAELEQHLPTLRRFRAIVQADYFSRRILNNDLTGIDDSTENDKGLNDARRMLQGLHVL